MECSRRGLTMEGFLDWYSQNAWAAWLTLAVVLAGVETLSGDFVLLMLAGAALVAAGSALFLPLAAQFAVAAVVAVALLMIVRPVIRRRILESTPPPPPGYERLIGGRAHVLDTISDRTGRVKIEGEEWSARYRPEEGLLPAAPGAQVEVLEIDGATLVVRPAPAVQDH